MVWRVLRRVDMLWLGERARRVHEAWLNEALKNPDRWPRIPTRRVSDGGFGPMMSKPEGRAWARQWWGDVLVESDDD